MSSPAELVAHVERRLRSGQEAVAAFWVQTDSPRDTLAAQITELRGDLPIVAFATRGQGFTNPDAVLLDLLDVISANRAMFADLPQPHDPSLQGRCAVILLSRGALCIPQTSSPITLPAWFPVAGGTQLITRIEDITWTTETTLNSPQCQAERLCELLFLLEGTALRVLRRSHDTDTRTTNSLLDCLRQFDKRAQNASFNSLLETARAEHATIRNPNAFRPQMSRPYLVSYLWQLAILSDSNALVKRAEALAEALCFKPPEEAIWHEALLAVLVRTHQRDKEADGTMRFARNLVVTVGAACQLITATHHADDYRLYPVPLLRSLSYDLARSLAASEMCLRASLPG